MNSNANYADFDYSLPEVKMLREINKTLSYLRMRLGLWQQDEMINDVLASIPEITNFHPLIISKTFII